KAHPGLRFVPVIMLTALGGGDDVVRGLDAGADHFISKPVPAAVLRAGVRAALRVRGAYRALQDGPEQARREERSSAAGLTARERRVLESLLSGASHLQIGDALGISERTAKFHQANLLAKLGAESRVDLIRLFL